MLVAFKQVAKAEGPPRRASVARPLAVGAVALVAGGLGTWWWQGSSGDVRYLTVAVAEAPLVARVTANGTIAARVAVQVGSQVSGRIQDLLVDFNSPVQRGQVLARLDPELFRAAAAQARANLTAAEGNLMKARARAQNAAKFLERAHSLVANDLISGADVDRAEADAAVGRGEIAACQGAVAQARAALRQAEVNVAYTTIRSPVEGVVISRNVDVGQTVAASLQAPTLFTIAEDLRAMQVHTNVPEADVGKLRASMKATFTVDAFPDERWTGVVREVRNASQVSQNVVTYDAVVDVENHGARLRPGMTATVLFVYAERERALVVPNTALRFQPRRAGRDPAAPGEGDERAGKGRRPIYLLVDGAPVRKLVRVGLSDGKVSEVVEPPLEVGQAVIVDEKGDGGRREGNRRLPARL